MANRSHKRETDARRKPKALAVIGPLAVLATAATVTVGVFLADPAARDAIPINSAASDLSVAAQEATAADADAAEAAAAEAARTEAPITRSNSRLTLPKKLVEPKPAYMSQASVKKAIDGAKTKLWTTTDLNLWSEPGDKARETGEVEDGKQVLVTGRTMWGRTEIVVDGESRWVTDGYLSEDKPVAPAAGLSMAPCPDGSVESGLTDAAVSVYRSVCHAFPQITSYGGWDGHGEHASGKAIDIMTSDVELGTAIAEFLRAHASELNLYDVIWRQHIWTPVRSAEGWRYMPSRGSTTANHYDHVHVSVY